jgi:peptide chain release factor 2
MSHDSYQPLIQEAQELLETTDVNAIGKKLEKLRQQTLKPGFWDLSHAQEIMQDISLLEDKKQQAHNLTGLIQDLQTSQELLTETTDEGNQQQLTKEAGQIASKLQKIVDQLSLTRYLSGPYDQKGAILSIHPGQGGTEAMDWSEMLERMYLRYFERKDWKYTLISETRGDEAGIKEAVFEVKAPYAYGYLKGERGTHRLVRQSPFNADNLRQTSFALVEVMPVIDQDPHIKLKEEDLSWHFTRSGGPGGQSVNKTNSAVELKHEPSGITVKSRESRSQVQNKETALKMLKAQLALRHEQQLEDKIAQEKGQHQHASWGTQIRNYVLHPYQLVKDTRTEVETSDSQAVLDGDLDLFIEEEIKL